MIFKAKKEIPKKLNICIVSRKFPIFGRAADRGFLWPIAKGLAAKGHDVTVLSWKNPRNEKEVFKDNVKVYYVADLKYKVTNTNFHKIVSQVIYDKFTELHKQKAFDLVHSVDSFGYLIGKFKKDLGVVVAFGVDSLGMSQLISIISRSTETPISMIKTGLLVGYNFLKDYITKDRQLLISADGVFVTSPQQKQSLEAYYFYPQRKTHTLPYGVELGDLNISENTELLKAELNIPKNSNIVATVSEMTEIDELNTLLYAFEKVAIKKRSAHLLIIGNGPLFKTIEYEVLKLALDSRVTFAQHVKPSELTDYISLAKVFVNISVKSSGFEPSLIEAMAQKKVVVGSEISPIADIIDHNKSGYLIRPADRKELSALILNVFNNEDLEQNIGQEAREKVINIFNTENMISQTLSSYNHILMDSNLYSNPT